MGIVIAVTVVALSPAPSVPDTSEPPEPPSSSYQSITDPGETLSGHHCLRVSKPGFGTLFWATAS